MLTVAFFVLMLPALRRMPDYYWAMRGRQADDPAQALEYFNRSDPDLVAEDMAAARRKLATDPDEQLAYLMQDVARSGWTDAHRETYIALQTARGDAELVRRMLGETTVDVGAMVLLVREDIQARNWANVQSLLERILAADPENQFANYHYGLMMAVDAPELAAGYLEAVAANREYAATVQRVSAVLTAGASPDEQVRSLGVTLSQIGEWAHAERAFTAAIEEDNLDWFSYAYRGYVRDEMGLDGLSDIEMAADIVPGAALPYYFEGLYWRRAPHINYAKAHEAFSRAYLLEPENPAIAIEIGNTFEIENQFELAADWYGIATSLDPDNVNWARIRAAFYADHDYYLEDEGLAIIEEAYGIAPDDPSLATSLGRAYYLLDRLPEARYQLTRAAEMAPDDPRTQFYLAILLAEEGNIEEAAEAYRSVVRIQGEDTGYGVLASRALSQLDD